MKELKIKLDTIEKVKNFVTTTTRFDCDFDISSISQRYTVDGKSIMGIFSLDLSRILTLKIHADNDAMLNEIETALTPYVIN